MTKFLFFLTLIFIGFSTFGQNKNNNVIIKGLAPAYVGKTIDVYAIQDYLTQTEEKIGSTTVKQDSSFSVSIPITETQKLIVKSNKNKAYLYVQKNGVYDVLLPEKDKYDPYKPTGNTVELTFFNLDSNDINYKILGFNRWYDNFIGEYFYLKNSKPLEFAKSLDTFKLNAQKFYDKDTSTYLKTYVRFTFASLDEAQSIGSRRRDEKHDFYLKHTPVQYKNDAYMTYLTSFYDNIMQQMNVTTRAKVNLGIEKKSPSQIINGLGGDYTMINLRIREIAMIKLLSEEYYKGDSYKHDILVILDSLSNHCIFKNNEIIAKNVKTRLLELVPGAKSPEFTLTKADGSIVNTKSLSGKHIYIHFYNPSSESCKKEVPLLKAFYDKFKDDVTFITIYDQEGKYTDNDYNILNGIAWDKFALHHDDAIYKQFKVVDFPYYVLIDQMGYVVSAPALGPQPNGQYETIEKTFYFIHDYNMKNR